MKGIYFFPIEKLQSLLKILKIIIIKKKKREHNNLCLEGIAEKNLGACGILLIWIIIYKSLMVNLTSMGELWENSLVKTKKNRI